MSDKPQVITVYLSKGGCSKSTLAALLASYLAGLGGRVAIVDMDRQGSQSEIFDLIGEDGRAGEILHMVLKRRVDAQTALTPIPADMIPRIEGCDPGALYVLQGGPQTSEAIDDILSNPVRYKIANTLDIVRLVIADLAGALDYVVIDMGPSDQLATIAGLVASDYLLIPTQTDFLSVSRIAPALEEVTVARQAQPINIIGIVTVQTRYYFGRLRKSKSVQVGEEFIRANYDDLLLRDDKGEPIDIPYDEAWRNAMWSGQNVLIAESGRRVRDDALRFCRAVVSELTPEVPA